MSTTQPTPLELVKKELPTIEALFALNSPSGTDVKTLALQELEYLSMIATSRPELFQCTPQSVLLAVKAIIKTNLSLDPNAGLVYLKTRSVNVGTLQNPAWQKVLEISPTANGLISINRQCGQILDIDRPRIIKDNNGKVTGVVLRYLVPSTPAPRWQEAEFDESDFMRWRIASHKENSRSWKQGDTRPQPNMETLNHANPNYTNWKNGPDPEFIRAKAIRHGLKKRGTNPNEGRATVIHMEAKHVVEATADFAATADEGNGFVQAEEVITNNQENNNGYVQFEDMPNATDL